MLGMEQVLLSSCECACLQIASSQCLLGLTPKKEVTALLHYAQIWAQVMKSMVSYMGKSYASVSGAPSNGRFKRQHLYPHIHHRTCHVNARTHAQSLRRLSWAHAKTTLASLSVTSDHVETGVALILTNIGHVQRTTLLNTHFSPL